MPNRGTRQAKINGISSGFLAIPRHFSPLQIVSHTHGLRYARSAMRVSQGEFGKRMGDAMGRRAIQQPTIANWEARRKPMQCEYVDTAVRVFLGWLVEAMGRNDLGARVRVNSPWEIRVMARCRCGRWYRLRRAEWDACAKCRRRGR